VQGFETDSGYNTGFYKCPIKNGVQTGYTTGELGPQPAAGAPSCERMHQPVRRAAGPVAQPAPCAANPARPLPQPSIQHSLTTDQAPDTGSKLSACC
jgi:hypothetical protein